MENKVMTMKSALKKCLLFLIGVAPLFGSNKAMAQRRLTNFGGGDGNESSILAFIRTGYMNLSPFPHGDYSPILVKPIVATGGAELDNGFGVKNLNVQASVTLPVVGNENPHLLAGRIRDGGTELGEASLVAGYCFNKRLDQQSHYEAMGFDINGGIKAVALYNKYYDNKTVILVPYVEGVGHFPIAGHLHGAVNLGFYLYDGHVNNENQQNNSTGPTSRGVMQFQGAFGYSF